MGAHRFGGRRQRRGARERCTEPGSQLLPPRRLARHRVAARAASPFGARGHVQCARIALSSRSMTSQGIVRRMTAHGMSVFRGLGTALPTFAVAAIAIDCGPGMAEIARQRARTTDCFAGCKGRQNACFAECRGDASCREDCVRDAHNCIESCPDTSPRDAHATDASPGASADPSARWLQKQQRCAELQKRGIQIAIDTSDVAQDFSRLSAIEMLACERYTFPQSMSPEDRILFVECRYEQRLEQKRFNAFSAKETANKCIANCVHDYANCTSLPQTCVWNLRRCTPACNP
jgi:hypothetical protein